MLRNDQSVFDNSSNDMLWVEDGFQNSGGNTVILVFRNLAKGKIGGGVSKASNSLILHT